ncbi:hypothetical protein ANN_23216 [Periplaneta americana]|uniref:Uncharacterized protein n=1 Tax=Periplaneta americana TaxID=6978 RepID=A0ABQ8SKK3_PERAM|nr:hypothetical protein ANN_23216 [Periplaneta americana]
MAGLCEGGNEPPGSLKAIYEIQRRAGGLWTGNQRFPHTSTPRQFCIPELDATPNSHRLITLKFAAYPGFEQATPLVPRLHAYAHGKLNRVVAALRLEMNKIDPANLFLGGPHFLFRI